jgi:formylglycine-generating enzyme required for sulfatase activity
MRPKMTALAILFAVSGTHSRLLAQYEKTPPIAVPAAVAASAAEMKPYTEPLEHTSFKIEMVPIPGGTFRMGSPDAEPQRRDDEGPQHEIQISPFWMSRHEITWNQYEVWGDRVDSLRRAA